MVELALTPQDQLVAEVTTGHVELVLFEGPQEPSEIGVEAALAAEVFNARNRPTTATSDK